MSRSGTATKRGKRRPNGQGSVFFWARRGRWVTDVSVPGGKRFRYYSTSSAEAHRKLREALTSIDRGEVSTDPDLTLARFLTEIYLPLDEAGNPKPGALLKGKPSHISRTAELIRLHLAPTPLGRMAVRRIGPLDVRRWQISKLEEVSPKTKRLQSRSHVRLMQVTLSGALHAAVGMELVHRNAAASVPLPEKSDFEGEAWDPEEALRFLAAAADDRLQDLFVVALLTGMRLGELLGLRWSAVHWESSRLTVVSNVVWIHGHAHHGDPKGPRSRRSIPLIPMAVEALRRQQRRQAVERLQVGAEWDGIDLVFPNTVGKPINSSTFRTRVYHALIAKANVKRIRFQDLRGTTATLLRFLGASDEVIKELLGHALAETTRRHYIHLQENPAVREALTRLGGLLAELETTKRLPVVLDDSASRKSTTEQALGGLAHHDTRQLVVIDQGS
jgi:integrase